MFRDEGMIKVQPKPIRILDTTGPEAIVSGDPD